MSRHRDTMKDPRFAGALYAIERCLHDADRRAAARGLRLTDSGIRSLLIRAINVARGKDVGPRGSVGSSDKDRFLAEALQNLATARATVVEERDISDGNVERRPIATSDWITALEAVRDSCAIHSRGEAGSRGYLDYVAEFLKDAG